MSIGPGIGPGGRDTPGRAAGLQGADWLVTTMASVTLLCARLLTVLWGARAAVSVDPLTAPRLE